MKDFLGNEIKVGDEVVFCMGGTNLRKDTIIEISEGEFLRVSRIKRWFNKQQVLKLDK